MLGVVHARQTEVADLQITVAVDEEIPRLEIAAVVKAQEERRGSSK